MLKNRMMLGAAVAATAVVVPLAGMTALAASPAGAAAAPKGIKCSAASGSVNTTTFSAKIKLTKCTGNTGASGKTKGVQGATSGTVKWANAKKTVFSEVVNPGTLCPAGGLADEVITGNVTSDTTGSTSVTAAVSGEICVSNSLTISLAPGTKFTFAA